MGGHPGQAAAPSGAAATATPPALEPRFAAVFVANGGRRCGLAMVAYSRFEQVFCHDVASAYFQKSCHYCSCNGQDVGWPGNFSGNSQPASDHY